MCAEEENAVNTERLSASGNLAREQFLHDRDPKDTVKITRVFTELKLITCPSLSSGLNLSDND